jgi:hypothetical protein
VVFLEPVFEVSVFLVSVGSSEISDSSASVLSLVAELFFSLVLVVFLLVELVWLLLAI